MHLSKIFQLLAILNSRLLFHFPIRLIIISIYLGNNHIRVTHFSLCKCLMTVKNTDVRITKTELGILGRKMEEPGGFRCIILITGTLGTV